MSRASVVVLRCSLLLALLCTFTVLLSCRRSTDTTIPEVFIISPHGEDIRSEFETAFSTWHQQHYGTPVKIQWPDVGGNGTGNIIRALSAEYATHPTSGYDIAFGGGSATFNDYDSRGFLEKANLPDSLLASIPKDIFGTPLRGPGDRWIASTMSNFGIVINKDRIAELHLNTPHTWADLAAPEWFGSLSLADPSKSGSVRSGYEMILQQYGWQKGWAVLTNIFANANKIRNSGSDPADDVGSAQAIAGIVIDFYGRKEALRVGTPIVSFIVPDGGSSLDPDPVAMLKGAPHADLAAHFIEFLLSPDGQRLWVLRAGTPGGPATHALGRMSLLPDLYTQNSQTMLDPTNPFAAVAHLQEDTPAKKARTAFLGDLVKSAFIDNHPALVAARAAIRAAGDPPDLLAKLDELPSFIPFTTDADGHLVEAPEQPLTASLPDQQAAALAFKPPEKSPLAPFTEHMQGRLKDLWRTQAAARYAALQTQPSVPRP